eukprot:COSAG02_NODE_2943_length_7690_cov_7.251482_4_plen_211_part_00
MRRAGTALARRQPRPAGRSRQATTPVPRLRALAAPLARRVIEGAEHTRMMMPIMDVNVQHTPPAHTHRIAHTAHRTPHSATPRGISARPFCLDSPLDPKPTATPTSPRPPPVPYPSTLASHSYVGSKRQTHIHRGSPSPTRQPQLLRRHAPPVASHTPSFFCAERISTYYGFAQTKKKANRLLEGAMWTSQHRSKLVLNNAYVLILYGKS